MNPFEMVLGIIIVVTIGRVLQARFKAREGTGMIDGADSRDARRLREEVAMLKDRIAVLERLATDDNNAVRLDREIEKLRDKL
ncbi:MAG: hypothetical protein B7Y45_06480 [Sphingomonas sp. 28-66-16]|nr:MAG: hypothetical protein B7Y45_06480 [Sphingomonas sp. 28-66-16]